MKVWRGCTVGLMALALAIAAGCGDDDEAAAQPDAGGQTDTSGGDTTDQDTSGPDSSDPDSSDPDSSGPDSSGPDSSGPDATPDPDTGGGPDATPDPDTGGQPDVTPGPDGGDVLVPGVDCQIYCEAITAACVGDDAQYASEAACLTYCQDVAPWSLGTDGDMDGNTLGCRIYHAEVAAVTDADVHCAHAGPSGGGTCGSWCENYCDVLAVGCTGGNAQFDSGAACLSHCEAVAAWPAGAPGDAAGNTVACRIYHAGMAALEQPGLHCPHAGPTGGNTCGSWCDNYCWLAGNVCLDTAALYDDDLECQAACSEIPSGGMPGAVGGDSIQCRLSQLLLAADEPQTYCPEAAREGSEACSEASAPVGYAGAGGAQEVFQGRCAPCHSGATVNGCSGGTCLASFYEATQLPSLTCPGDNMAGCSLTRMINQTMPPIPQKATQAEIDIIDAWIQGGELP